MAFTISRYSFLFNTQYNVSLVSVLNNLLKNVHLALCTGLSMLEQEQSWELIQQGRPKDYHGVAVHPRHLSVFERVILKRHHQYQPKAQQLPSHTAQTSMAAVNGGLSSTGVDNKQTARDSEAA